MENKEEQSNCKPCGNCELCKFCNPPQPPDNLETWEERFYENFTLRGFIQCPVDKCKDAGCGAESILFFIRHLLSEQAQAIIDEIDDDEGKTVGELYNLKEALIKKYVRLNH